MPVAWFLCDMVKQCLWYPCTPQRTCVLAAAQVQGSCCLVGEILDRVHAVSFVSVKSLCSTRWLQEGEKMIFVCLPKRWPMQGTSSCSIIMVGLCWWRVRSTPHPKIASSYGQLHLIETIFVLGEADFISTLRVPKEDTTMTLSHRQHGKSSVFLRIAALQ